MCIRAWSLFSCHGASPRSLRYKSLLSILSCSLCQFRCELYPLCALFEEHSGRQPRAAPAAALLVVPGEERKARLALTRASPPLHLLRPQTHGKDLSAPLNSRQHWWEVFLISVRFPSCRSPFAACVYIAPHQIRPWPWEMLLEAFRIKIVLYFLALFQTSAHQLTG